MKRVAIITFCAALSVSVSANEAVVVLPALPRDGGATQIVPAVSGEYVYSAAPQPLDGRLQQRFVIKPPQRTSYTLFSAQEEQALWQLRESMRPRPAPLSIDRAARRSTHIAAVIRAKVLVRGTQTCVPATGFADTTEWRQHLVCWDKEKRSVVTGQ